MRLQRAVQVFGAALLAALLASCSTLGSTSSRTACRVQQLLEESGLTMEDGMTATLNGDSVAVVAAGDELQRLAGQLRDMLEFLRDLSTDVVDDIEGAATIAQQTGASLSAVSAAGQVDMNLLNRARDSIGAAEGRWVQRVRNAGVSCG